MKTTAKVLAALAGAGVLLAAGGARAESTYGYNAAGVGTVTATARLNVTVTVPKLVVLRVGSTAGTIDTAAFTVNYSIPGLPTTPAATANSVTVDWTGAAPTPTSSAAVPVNAWAWTNASNVTLNCAAAAFAAGGPTLANITVGAGAGTLPHPGANLGACAATPALTANAVRNSTWTYTLGGAPATWAAGAYTTQVTYTASGT